MGCPAECGIYPGDTTNRFRTDYQQIYQTAQTPNLQNLVGSQPHLLQGSFAPEILTLPRQGTHKL